MAQEQKPGPERVPDPVCGMMVPTGDGAISTEYKDKTFYFCSEECKEEFGMDPEMYSVEGDLALEEEETF